VRGTVIDYKVVEVGGRELLIHQTLLNQLTERPPTRAVQVVGVAEQRLFWKDLRRVLFDGSKFRVLARLGRDGLQQSWTPVKLVDVLRSVAPDFAMVMDSTSRTLAQSMSREQTAPLAASSSHPMRRALIEYASLLAQHTGVTVETGDLEPSGLLEARDGTSPAFTQDRRTLFEPITHWFEERAGAAIDRSVAADLRASAMQTAGVGPDALPTPSADPPALPADSAAETERFLDAEIVAIYW
jgi:hypothetical protein